jgi:Zn-dependent peptidase ImmA (M78 family)
MGATSRVAIRAAITQLYMTAGMAEPNVHRRITPLGELLGCFNLVCAEVSQLTQRRALQYLAQQGALVEMAETSGSEMDEALAGFLYVTPSYGCIFAEQEDSVVRRRFSVAHELGHHVLHFQPLLVQAEQEHAYLELFEAQHAVELGESEDLSLEVRGRIEIAEEGDLRARLPPYKQMEREANQFAAELLMPIDVVRGLAARWMLALQGDDLVRRLAAEMLVSADSMRWRLHELGLLLGSSESGVHRTSA